jgi:uncharacterized membrane protein YhaH (DUF805 family)
MKGIRLIVLMIVLSLAISILVVVIPTLAVGVNLRDSIDASTVNGLITATAIVFAFVSFEAREIESFRAKFLFLMTLIVFLMFTGLTYYADVMQTGHVTKAVLLVAMTNFYFDILSFEGIMLVKQPKEMKLKEEYELKD